MDDPQIVPAILATTEEEYQEQLEKITESGLFEWVHIDFTVNSVSPEIVNRYQTTLKREAHIMVEGLKVEGMDRVIRDGVNPEDELPDLKDKDFVLIMGVHPGEQGQQFIPKTIQKINEASRLRSTNNLKFLIGVDGGVSSENIRSIIEAGADHIVVGSHLTKGDIHENIEKFWEALR